MNLSAYDEFFEANREGRKSAAAAAVRVFIASFSSFEEKQAWVTQFLEKLRPEERIRHELYEELVFPVLLKSYRNSEVWGAKWLAATSQNLYRAKNIWAQVDFITEHALLKIWNTLEPANGQAKAALLRKMIEWFGYSEHEWPAGILYGMNGASLEQCSEIAYAIGEARMLDVNRNYTSYLIEFEKKLNSYMQRLG